MAASSSNCYVNQNLKSSRNQSMECWKIIASFLVVFNHASFPGTLGSIIVWLGGFAVPVFFMICGYFNYQATSEQIARRTKHIVKLLLIGTFAHILWNCIATELEGGSTIAYLRAAIPDPDEVVRWIILHVHPYAGHFWYLNASIACYLVFYVFTRFSGSGQINYRPFYFLCLNLFILSFALDSVASAAGLENTGLVTRSGWFVGIPMFGIGLFIRQYQERIFSMFHLPARKLLFLIIAGAMFTILQGATVGIGVLPIGTLVGVISLMLFLVSHPTMPAKSSITKKIILELGPISTWIYLFHLIYTLCYQQFLREPFTAIFADKEPYLYPLWVACVSLLTAILCQCFSHLSRKMSNKRKHP